MEERRPARQVLSGPKTKHSTPSMGALKIVFGALIFYACGTLVDKYVPSLVVVGVFFVVAAIICIFLYRSVVNGTQ